MNGNTVINFTTIVIQMNSCTKHEQKVTWRHIGHMWNYRSLIKYRRKFIISIVPDFSGFQNEVNEVSS